MFLTGASSGIGRATAEALVARGHDVWGTSRDPQRVPKLPRLRGIEMDLAGRESVVAAFAAAKQQAGGIDVLINNAGSGQFGPGELLPESALEEQFRILVFAQIELCRLALAGMRKRDAGLIINVTSLASRLPVPFMSAYNAAKAAMASFTMSLQLELERSNVFVVDLQPGDIRTAFNDAIPDTRADASVYGQRVQKAWQTVDHNMRSAPGPELVARRIVELIADPNPPPRVPIGDPFQAVVAPLIFRILPQRVRLWGLRKYYGI